MSAAAVPAVVTEGLTREFGEVRAVDDLGLEVRRGEIFGLIGPDGAGKTTLFRMLAAVMEPTRGTARIAGLDVRREPEAVKARIGYMPQAFSLYGDLSVAENLRFVAEVYGVPRPAAAARTDRLLHMSRLAPFAGRPADQLSGGMRQKLALAATLLHEPEVLLLDEPTTGVDPISRREFWQILYDLNRGGITAVIATPYMDEAERCTRVGLMYQGRLLAVDRPAVLQAGVSGVLLEVLASPRQAALTAVRQLPEVVEATVFGAGLHVLVSRREAAAAIPEALRRRGLSVGGVREIDSSLEDLFVLQLKTRRAAGDS